VKLLLDTHAFLWWIGDPERLGGAARAAIADRGNEVSVSAATIWEITTKYRIGKLPAVAPIVDRLPLVVAEEGFAELPVTLEHAARAGLLPGEHRDPFDRMLIAQALCENLLLVSIEGLFEGYGVRRVW